MSVFEGALVVSRAARRIDSFAAAIEALAEFIEPEPRQPAGKYQAARVGRAGSKKRADDRQARPGLSLSQVGAGLLRRRVGIAM